MQICVHNYSGFVYQLIKIYSPNPIYEHLYYLHCHVCQFLQETAEFSIQFDKVYHWSASNIQERLVLFSILWKLCSKYLPKQSPMFVNIPPGIVEETVMPETSVALDHEGIDQSIAARSN